MTVLSFIQILLQITWGLPQTLIGGLVCLKYSGCPHRIYRASVFTDWKRPGGISLGPFIFAEQSDNGSELDIELIRHEYGHSIQSLILGPLYLPVVGIPSLLWANLPYFRNLRSRKHIGYYRMFIERWASRLGGSRLV